MRIHLGHLQAIHTSFDQWAACGPAALFQSDGKPYPMQTLHISRHWLRQFKPMLKSMRQWRLVPCVLLCVLVGHSAWAQPDAAPSKTESPYFYLPGADPKLDALPLKGTQVDVRIAGVIADVTVTQTYKNEGARPIEAKYLFPGSTRAAVYAMNVRLGDRLITAKI